MHDYVCVLTAHCQEESVCMHVQISKIKCLQPLALRATITISNLAELKCRFCLPRCDYISGKKEN